VVIHRQFVRGQKQHGVRRLAVYVHATTPRDEFRQNLLFSDGELIAHAIGPVKRQAAKLHEERLRINRRHAAPRDESDDLVAQRVDREVG
jgi:hypothetical protein